MQSYFLWTLVVLALLGTSLVSGAKDADHLVCQLPEGSLQDLQENLEARLNGTEGQLQDIQNTLVSLQESLRTLLAEKENRNPEPAAIQNIPPKFERILDRYFYIEHNLEVDWASAADICRKINGHLAALKNEEELAAIQLKLRNDWYHLGISDEGHKGEFTSVASGKPAVFLKWNDESPENAGKCVQLKNGGFMGDYYCSERVNFICQLDTDV
ncbi:C-type lectin 37Db-like [Drosophila takahashii]|uniref:C-type lectin 37Db-like n=1 Tax=Drosophila takahashii TaxID=29030 RepID=UPI001CF86435|nr:accessory gland protein Acp29AB-like [Drosophila takahashii]